MATVPARACLDRGRVVTTAVRLASADPIAATNGQCQIAINDALCTRSGVSRWRGGCIHEHITTDILLCEEHEERGSRPWICLPCKRGDNPHRCPVTLTKDGAS